MWQLMQKQWHQGTTQIHHFSLAMANILNKRTSYQEKKS
jgi:hypothetical protein